MKRFAVIGLGNFGYHVARALYEEGGEVMAVDRDKARVQAAGDHATQAVVQDATDREALEALGLGAMDAVIVSTGTRISVSIIICLHLHEMGVKRIVVKAQDEDHAKVLERVGATEVVNPERDMAERLSRSLARPNVLDFVPLTDDYDLVEVAPSKALIGKSLKDIDLRARYDVYVIGVKEHVPEGFVLAPPANFVVKDSDVLLLLGKSGDIRQVRELG